MEYTIRHRVTGSTVINHNVRLNLKLSLEEYTLLDFIHNWNKLNNNPITFANYYSQTGFIYTEIDTLFKLLKEKGLLVWDAPKKRVDVSDEWKDIFNTDRLFTSVWKMHPHGAKQIAKERLPKVLRKISLEDLQKKLKQYLAFCKENNRFAKDLSTWLNPKNEHWNDPIGKVQQDTTPKINVTFK